MTREQAVKSFQERHNNYSPDWAERWIDAFSELGMLKLDEPKSKRDRFKECLLHRGYYPASRGLMDALGAYDEIHTEK